MNERQLMDRLSSIEDSEDSNTMDYEQASSELENRGEYVFDDVTLTDGRLVSIAVDIGHYAAATPMIETGSGFGDAEPGTDEELEVIVAAVMVCDNDDQCTIIDGSTIEVSDQAMAQIVKHLLTQRQQNNEF